MYVYHMCMLDRKRKIGYNGSVAEVMRMEVRDDDGWVLWKLWRSSAKSGSAFRVEGAQTQIQMNIQVLSRRSGGAVVG
jgi:hypothetical protein